MGPIPSRRLLSVAFVVVALTLAAACGDADRPAPRDEASLAPFVATPELIVEEMLRMANVGKDDVVYDLGSGDGRIVIAAAKIHGSRGSASNWPRASSSSPPRTHAGRALRI